MSGPKVVRIVSRDEIREICTVWLARVDAEISEWKRVGERNRFAEEKDVTEISNRRRALQKLIDTERFDELQKQAPLQIEWLQRDLSNKFEKSMSVETQRNREKRSLEFAAKSILEEIARGNVVINLELQQSLQKVQNGVLNDIIQAEKVVSQGIATLASARSVSSEETSKLASKLNSGNSTRTLEEWLVQTNHVFTEDPRIAKLSEMISRLDRYESNVASTFRTKLREITNGSDAKRKNLLLDSIGLEMSAEIEKSSDFHRVTREIAVLIEEAHITKAYNSLSSSIEELRESLKTKNMPGLRQQISDIKQGIQEFCRKKAAEIKRVAMLHSLKELGYEVQEGMSTTWAQNNRVVVRNSKNPAVALELGGNPETSKCQIRVVSIEGAGHDRSNDKLVEEQWCGDISSLKQILSRHGTEIVIERSTPAGAVPLKTVANEWIQYDDEVTARKQREL